jgi:hypothetical protein
MNGALAASLPARLLIGAGAGVVATLVMDRAMARLPEGTTPPAVAAGVLSDRPLSAAPERLAAVVHYVAGIGSGVLYVALSTLLAAAGVVATGVPAFLAAAAVQLPVMIAFFAYLVVPAYGRVPTDRVARVRLDWALSAAVYVPVLAVVVALAAAVV